MESAGVEDVAQSAGGSEAEGEREWITGNDRQGVLQLYCRYHSAGAVR